MKYKVESKIINDVDLSVFDKFYSFWHSWIEENVDYLRAREFLLAGNILIAMDDFSDYFLANAVPSDEELELGDDDKCIEFGDDDSDNNNDNNNDNTNA